MFVPVKCKIEIIRNLGNYTPLTEIQTIDQTNHIFYKRLLNQCNSGGVLDGSNLQQLTFPFEKQEYDVFISYSHNDEQYASILYQYLTDHGLKCFLDSTVWCSADALLSEIDKQYCMAEDGRHYDYTKRNFSTSHVHTMLGMAMMEAIDRSELILFIESDKSLSLRDGITNKTLSPWIYQELQIANHINPRIPSRMRSYKTKLFCNRGIIAESEAVKSSLQIEYNVNFDNFHNLDLKDLFHLKAGIKGLDYVYKAHGICKD